MPDVLVIDDDDMIREMLLETLEKEGFSARGAENGEVALKELKCNRYDVVITDILMPEKEGLETIRFLKNEMPEVPIIAISGGGLGSADFYCEIAQGLGARYSFTKPFRSDEILTAVRNCLSK
jgi:two-component system chemotaxis response regulator CheY